MARETNENQWRIEALSALYDADSAVAIEAEVQELLAERLGTATDGGDKPASQADVWLIAYPDHFTDGAHPTLEVLQTVADRYLAPAITGIHVLPFHPASSDRGFSVEDYATVGERFGDWDTIAAIGARYRLMADAVINHMSTQGPWFQAFLAGDAPYDRFFRTATRDADLDAVVRPRTSPLLTEFQTAQGAQWVWTTFSPDQVDLDFRSPEVLIAVMDALAHYVEFGAAAIRLDAIAFMWKQEGTTSIHLPETHLLIQLMRSWFDEYIPDVLLITETNVPHVENWSYLNVGARREAQAVYQFALPPLVLHSARTGRVDELVSWFGSLDELPQDRTVLNFLASHDGVGVRPAEGLLDDDAVMALAALCHDAGGAVNYRSVPGVGERPYELCSTWFSLMSAIDDDADAALARHICCYAICIAAAGIPLIYVNALFAASNDTATYATTQHARDLNRAGFTLDALDATLADTTSIAARSYRAITTLASWRQSDDAFDPTASQQISAAGPGAISIARHGETTQAMIVVNLGAEPVAVELAGEGWQQRSAPNVVALANDDDQVVASLSVGWWVRSMH